jgi:hypothetical protein
MTCEICKKESTIKYFERWLCDKCFMKESEKRARIKNNQLNNGSNATIAEK